MAGERKRSPPPAARNPPQNSQPSWHQSDKLRGLGQSPRTYASSPHLPTAHKPAHPGGIGYMVYLHTQVSYPTHVVRPGSVHYVTQRRTCEISGKIP